MKIVKAKIYVLKIPFNFSFGHFLKIRKCSDSIIVELTTDTGVRGYGEGIARPYVTGETIKKSISHIKDILLPAIMHRDIQSIETSQNLQDILIHMNNYFPNISSSGIIAWNASRAAVELAIIDCLLKKQQKSLNCILPAKSQIITYSGVFSSESLKNTIDLAKRSKRTGFKYIKIKVGKRSDLECIAAARDIMGQSVSIRLDANGAFSVKGAIQFIKSVEKFNIDSVEQPIKRGDVVDLAIVKANSSIPIMADESIVTYDDAKKLIKHNACDYFNLRISKCGGLYRTLAIAALAEQEGIKLQLGCHVGETAVLSAAGRHLAAYLPNVKFVEGSYSTLLLVEDISRENIVFGNGGEAPVFTGYGLGINIREELVEKYSRNCIVMDK
jgi:muconate cycloisomerase